MSIPINSQPSSYTLPMPPPGEREPASDRNHIQEKAKQTAFDANAQRNSVAELVRQQRQDNLDKIAERMTESAEAVTARFDDIQARWSKQFAVLEQRAIENGHGARAEKIAEFSEKMDRQLDDVSRRMASQLDRISERISAALAERYEVAGNNASTQETPGIDEVA